jgi:hypothetical protein
MIRDQFVASLARQDERCHGNGNSAESLKTPGHSAHDPALIKVPADKETIIVLEEVGLYSKRVSTF